MTVASAPRSAQDILTSMLALPPLPDHLSLKVMAIPAIDSIVAAPALNTVAATFVYDGDGNRVKSVIGNVTTYFVGNYFELTGETLTITKYYYAGGQRIAMRTYPYGGSASPSYILSDHLGSTSITTTNLGTKVSETRYKPWGEVRYQSGITPTDYTYTGQFSYAADFGLLYYNARWYDPYLNHFTQPDSIVPAGVQGYDRYAYVNNNPLKYTDPTGHMQVCDRGDEGIEGELHTSSCGSGADMKQIKKAFDDYTVLDEEHHGKGYSDYYAAIHGVVTDLDLYLENINIEDEGETAAMRDKRISRFEKLLEASVGSARIIGQNLHYALRQDAWNSDAEFPEILGGGYIVDNGAGTLGDGAVPGTGEFSSFSISDIVYYYTRTSPPPFFPGLR